MNYKGYKTMSTEEIDRLHQHRALENVFNSTQIFESYKNLRQPFQNFTVFQVLHETQKKTPKKEIQRHILTTR